MCPMSTVDKLNRAFFTQQFSDELPYAELLNRYKAIACNYAHLENAIAVLSDLRTNVSYIYYGRFAKALGITDPLTDHQVASIWEEEIFNLIHPDDLSEKHLQELCFFHFIKKQPKKSRANYYLMSQIRMKTGNAATYMSVWHRMFYISIPAQDTMWLALCLYSPLPFDLPAQCLIVNSVNGHTSELKPQNNAQILSARERQILNLVDKGMMSKEIAQLLSISKHTVSRHRQDILSKLQVKNSIEACRIAKDLGII